MVWKDGGPVLGIIGGGGISNLSGLEGARWETTVSPFGMPSDQLLYGTFNGQRLVFLPRHGRGHRLPPSDVNYRANIDVLKRAGATEIISVSAVGSLREDLPPGSLVIVDQFIDRTSGRANSFFTAGMAAHVSMATPVCPRLCDALEAGARAAGVPIRRGATLLVIDGPQFSTRAESNLYRQWGCDLLGMSNMPEAKLAREAELCYAALVTVTDYDSWHPEHEQLTAEALLQVYEANAARGRQVLTATIGALGERSGPCRHGCQWALDHALITRLDQRDPDALEKLDAVAGRLLGT